MRNSEVTLSDWLSAAFDAAYAAKLYIRVMRCGSNHYRCATGRYLPIFECQKFAGRARITRHEHDSTDRNAALHQQLLCNKNRPDGICFQVIVEIMKRAM